jgi:hypothetical protein
MPIKKRDFWATLTRKEAIALRTAARAREQEVGRRFERDEATQEEFFAAMVAEENLHVFILTGMKPGDY